MFKSELWQNHDEYRTMVNQVSRRLLRNNPKYLFSSMNIPVLNGRQSGQRVPQ